MSSTRAFAQALRKQAGVDDVLGCDGSRLANASDGVSGPAACAHDQCPFDVVQLPEGVREFNVEMKILPTEHSWQEMCHWHFR